MKCKYCRKEAQLVKKPFSNGVFWGAGILTWGLWMIVYPIYRLCLPKNRCHHCGAKIQ